MEQMESENGRLQHQALFIRLHSSYVMDCDANKQLSLLIRPDICHKGYGPNSTLEMERH
jgi:hypothetical protein